MAKVKPQTLIEALNVLRYVKVGENEWRHGKYHLFIRRRRKSGLTLSLHVDNPSPLPPFHRARHKGKDLEAEVQKILDAYTKRRSAGWNSQV